MPTFLLSLFILSAACAQAAQEHALLLGEVSDSLGLPSAGASVYLEAPGRTEVTVSDLQGRYAFKGLEPGAYTLRVFGGEESFLLEGLELGAGMEQRLDPVLKRQGGDRGIKVRVKAVTVNPAEDGAEYRFALEAAQEPLAHPGLARLLAALPAGEYDIVITRPGMAYVGGVLVFDQGLGRKRVSYVGGLAIQGSDFIQAVSSQAQAQSAAALGL